MAEMDPERVDGDVNDKPCCSAAHVCGRCLELLVSELSQSAVAIGEGWADRVGTILRHGAKWPWSEDAARRFSRELVAHLAVDPRVLEQLAELASHAARRRWNEAATTSMSQSQSARRDSRSMLSSDQNLDNITLLVVDDDDDARELAGVSGVKVFKASSAPEAFAAFERERPDMIICGVRTLHGAGLELIRRVRSLPPERGGLVPAISVSAGALKDACLDAGFHFDFTTPLPPTVLVEAIRSFLRDEPESHNAWCVDVDERTIYLRLIGHVTAGDMRTMTATLVSILKQNPHRFRIISDLRKMSSFTPAVAAVVQSGIWNVRKRIDSVVVVGASSTAWAISRSTCFLLRVPCSLSSEIPCR